VALRLLERGVQEVQVSDLPSCALDDPSPSHVETAMTDTPTDTLRQLRDVLVEQRRRTADEAARLIPSDLHATLQKISTVLAYQAQIEGIDRVILDEGGGAATA
jgi:hypothetical protein